MGTDSKHGRISGHLRKLGKEINPYRQKVTKVWTGSLAPRENVHSFATFLYGCADYIGLNDDDNNVKKVI